jgi:hypothetical protein
MQVSWLSALALVTAIASAGCDEKTSEGSVPAEKVAEKVVQKGVETLFVGDKPTLPTPYKGLSLGMAKADAIKANAALAEDSSLKPAEYDGMWFSVDIDKKSNVIERLYFDVPKATADAMVEKAWGPATKGQTSLGKPMGFWFNAEAGLRVTLKDGYGEEKSVEFTHYLPAAKLIGADTASKLFAFEAPQALLGASADALRTAYAGVLIEKSMKQAKADRKKIVAIAGKKANVLGSPKPSMHLELAPTEYESYWTRVHFTFDDENKVRRYWFKLAFERNPAAKDVLFGLLKSKLGEPKEAEKYGDKIFIFSEANPYIEVKEDTISKGWDVSVDVKK